MTTRERLVEAALEQRLRDLSKVIVDHLGGGSEWFSRIGDEFYADPKIIKAELQRRQTDARITKRAMFLANQRLSTLNKEKTDAK